MFDAICDFSAVESQSGELMPQEKFPVSTTTSPL
jgi:hypothetical protein